MHSGLIHYSNNLSLEGYGKLNFCEDIPTDDFMRFGAVQITMDKVATHYILEEKKVHVPWIIKMTGNLSGIEVIELDNLTCSHTFTGFFNYLRSKNLVLGTPGISEGDSENPTVMNYKVKIKGKISLVQEYIHQAGRSGYIVRIYIHLNSDWFGM